MTNPPFRSLLTAWHFLTIVPLPGVSHEPTPRELARSMGWYPLIGLALGGFLVACDWLFSNLFSPGVQNLLLMIVLVGMTGGLHQDGLADMLDGLAGGKTPAERLTIMRDPRVGAIGATGLALDLGLRLAGLMALPQAMRLPALLCLPAVGRWAMVIGAWGAPYARAEGGLAAPFLQELSWRDAMAATIVMASVVAWGLGPVAALAGCGLVALVARALTRTASRLCGGITGDVLGAINEFAEILFLLILPVLGGP